MIAWLPIDCAPLGTPDREALLASGAYPVAMSRFGAKRLQAEGFPHHYIPHGVDLQAFTPLADRGALRRELGLDEFFLVGICAANSDAFRKAWPEQFEAFRAFAATAPDARLMVHSVARTNNGFDLAQLAADIGIADKVIFSDQYPQVAGLMGDDAMAGWFGCLDVLSACSYAEGFGLPIIEAMACGTPVVTTAASAMTEIGYPLHVEGSDWWNPVHRAWWKRPDVEEITFNYITMYQEPRTAGWSQIRDKVLAYDIRKNVHRWETLLRRVMAGREDSVVEMDAVSAYPPELIETAADRNLADTGPFGSER